MIDQANKPRKEARYQRSNLLQKPLSQLHYYMAHSSAAYAGPTDGVLMTAEYLVLSKATVQSMGNSRLLKSEYQGSPSNLLCGICRCSPAGLVGIMQTRKSADAW